MNVAGPTAKLPISPAPACEIPSVACIVAVFAPSAKLQSTVPPSIHVKADVSNRIISPVSVSAGAFVAAGSSLLTSRLRLSVDPVACTALKLSASTVPFTVKLSDTANGVFKYVIAPARVSVLFAIGESCGVVTDRPEVLPSPVALSRLPSPVNPRLASLIVTCAAVWI